MIASSSQDRTLPFLPTLLCLWGAGWVTSLVTSLVFLGRVYATGAQSTVVVAVNLLLSAAVGAVVVRYLLLSVVDCELAYGATLVALVAGSAASTVVRLIVLSGLGGGSPGALPSAGLAAFVVPGFVGAVVSWRLLQNAARLRASSTTGELPGAGSRTRIVDGLDTGDPTVSAYSEVVSAVRESALGLVGAVNSVPSESVPTVVVEGLVPYEAALKRLERAQLPSSVSRDLNDRLVAGLRQLAEDVTSTGTASAAISGGGGRFRFELEQSEGLRTVKRALDDLRALGFGGP